MTSSALIVGSPIARRLILAAAVLAVEQAMAEIGRQAFVHEGLGIAVGADGVVPPLMADFVRDEVVHVAFRQVRQIEDALVNHHHAAAFVAVPAKE